MIIAVPKYGIMIAPCFETASNFLIAVAEEGKIILSRQAACTGCIGFGRVNLLKDNNVNILICSGIKTFYQNLLTAADIQVISQVNINAEKAIELYLAGSLTARIPYDDEATQPLIPLDDLICWSKDIFSINGYRIIEDPASIPFPVDFLAEFECPVCHKSIMIAVCCGAHAYKADYEIREFEHVSRSPKFHGRIYVHPGTEAIKNRCAELSIELLDPFDESLEGRRPGPKTIPLLKTPIIGHEKAFMRAGDGQI